jgi:hypothetical protein
MVLKDHRTGIASGALLTVEPAVESGRGAPAVCHGGAPIPVRSRSRDITGDQRCSQDANPCPVGAITKRRSNPGGRPRLRGSVGITAHHSSGKNEPGHTS